MRPDSTGLFKCSTVMCLWVVLSPLRPPTRRMLSLNRVAVKEMRPSQSYLPWGLSSNQRLSSWSYTHTSLRILSSSLRLSEDEPSLSGSTSRGASLSPLKTMRQRWRQATAAWLDLQGGTSPSVLTSSILISGSPFARSECSSLTLYRSLKNISLFLCLFCPPKMQKTPPTLVIEAHSLRGGMSPVTFFMRRQVMFVVSSKLKSFIADLWFPAQSSIQRSPTLATEWPSLGSGTSPNCWALVQVWVAVSKSRHQSTFSESTIPPQSRTLSPTLTVEWESREESPTEFIFQTSRVTESIRKKGSLSLSLVRGWLPPKHSSLLPMATAEWPHLPNRTSDFALDTEKQAPGKGQSFILKSAASNVSFPIFELIEPPRTWSPLAALMGTVPPSSCCERRGAGPALTIAWEYSIFAQWKQTTPGTSSYAPGRLRGERGGRV